MRRSGSGTGGVVGALWPLALYLVVSIGLFGIPIIGHLRSHIVAYSDGDPSVYMWFFAWWPHALLHGINPFVTHQILYPDGYNLQWAASMPLPSILLAPVTLGLGPAVTWNVVELLSPALGAWTAFLLCRHITRRSLPSLLAGYLFGFSPYVLLNLQASPNLALVALVPVFVLIVLRRLEDVIGPGRFVVEMALAVAAQYLIGTEVLATSVLFGAVALVLAWLLLPARRAGLLDVVKLLAASLVAAAVLVSPFIYFFITGPHYPPTNTNFPADLTSFVLPPSAVALQLHGGQPFVGSALEDYLGLPVLILVGVFLWRRRRDRSAVLLVLCALIAGLASLGPRLLLHGRGTSVWLPWRLFRHLPVLSYAIPARFVLFVILPLAVIVALWLAGDGDAHWGAGGAAAAGRFSVQNIARWGLALLAVAFIVPNVGSADWNTRISDPPFFQHHAYRAYLRGDDHVLTEPFFGPNQRWIADAGFPFALSAGSGGQGQPRGYTKYPIYRTLIAFPFPLPPHYAVQLRRFLEAKRVTAIVIQQGFPGPWHKLFGTLGVRPVATGGVLLYRLADHGARGSDRHSATVRRPRAATPT